MSKVTMKPIIGWEGEVAQERWYDENHMLHRENDLPAVVGNDGYESYYTHGHMWAVKFTGESEKTVFYEE